MNMIVDITQYNTRWYINSILITKIRRAIVNLKVSFNKNLSWQADTFLDQTKYHFL